jgi:hypothetical protein
VRAALVAGTIAAGVAVWAPGRAHADPAEAVSAEGAEKLERQLHDWLATTLGPKVTIGDRPFQVTADSDHYSLEIPFAGALAGATGVTVEGANVTAKLTPLDGGRWAVDDVHSPSPLHIAMPIPVAGAATMADITATFASQEQHAIIDPSLATPSHWDSTIKGYNSTMAGPGDVGTRTTSMDELSLHAAWEPGADGRLNVLEEGDSHLLASNSMVPDVGPVSVSVEKVHGSIRLDGVATDQVATLMHAAMDLAPAGVAAAKKGGGVDQQKIAALAAENHAAADADRRDAEADKQAVAAGKMTLAERKKRTDERHARAQARMEAMQAARTPAPAAPPQLSAEQEATAKTALVALAGLLTGFDEHGTMENMHVSAAGHSGHLDKFAGGFSASAPDGKALIRLNFAIDGLDSPEIPPGVYRDYLPRHLSISPRVGGVPAADLHDLLLRAANSGGDDPQLQEQAMALLAKGPLAVGVDELSFDFGPATLKGTGEVRISGMNEYEGEAHFVATGLDDLIKKAATVPELKQAGPVLFLVKGMGKQDGATTVWDVTYSQGKLLVNGNDLSQMMPGAN